MTHVIVRPSRISEDGTAFDYQVTIDGVDVYPLAEGFSITFPEPAAHVPVVTMQFWVDKLDVDLPNAVVEALKVRPPETDG